MIKLWTGTGQEMDTKKISKALSIPRCTVKSIIKKVKVFGTTENQDSPPNWMEEQGRNRSAYSNFKAAAGIYNKEWSLCA